MLPLYRVLTLAGSLLVLPAMYVRTAGNPAGRRSIRERLGRIPSWPGEAVPPASPDGLWLQAVSVGEVRVAATLLRALRKASPGLRVALSATTASGLEQAALLTGVGTGDAARLAELVFAFPLDLHWVTRRALDSLRPAAYGSVETEIWPGLLSACGRRGIPTLIVNGALSERSARRWRRWMAGAVREGLSALRAACMQSDEDARRLLELGAPREAVVVTGNMKFDAGRPDLVPAAEALRRSLSIPGDLPVMIAGSTSPGEEALVLEAWKRILASDPGMALILAPRHRERFDEAAAIVKEKGGRLVRRSMMNGADPPRPGDILLLDSIGELEAAYALADVAFVGGSLVPRGGQNPLEPARAGVPILFGPGMDNFREIADGLRDCGGAQEVTGAASLAARVLYFRRNRAARESASAALRRFVEAHAGATRRTLEALTRRIPEIFA
jgi:3-deoxy-D-manno-octulosonic-acid transferase